MVIDPRFDGAQRFSDGLAPVNLGGRPGLPYQSDWGEFGLEGGRWGYVDLTGNLAIEPKYLTIHDFQNGRAEVIDDEGLVIIDRAGQVIERPKPPE
jgi:hypothetical protein